MNENFLDNFKQHKDWVKVWSGRWSLHFDSEIGNDWTNRLRVAGKPPFSNVIYFYSNAITDCWVSQKEKDYLGKRFVSLATKDKKYLYKLAKELKMYADKVTNFLDSHDPKNLSPEESREFWELAGNYYLPHLSVKYSVDYLSEKELKQFLPALEEARLYAEPIFRNTENFFEDYAETVARDLQYTKEMILATTRSELGEYFKTGKLPPKRVLKQRYDCSALVVHGVEQKLFMRKDVEAIEAIIAAFENSEVINGQVAYKGFARGKVRVVISPKNAKLQPGEILVTGMTRPEFLPLMKLASAFVTDAGGILSHAAITAREMKKPCIIGTKNATKVFRDGDLVEVDANKGIVRKI
jgi:phosphohistidine swiveling domain-containing protein